MKAKKIIKTQRLAWIVKCETDGCDNAIAVPKRPGVTQPDARLCTMCGMSKFVLKSS